MVCGVVDRDQGDLCRMSSQDITRDPSLKRALIIALLYYINVSYTGINLLTCHELVCYNVIYLCQGLKPLS